MSIQPIYLDHHATTPVDPRVAKLVLYAMTDAFGNANSVDHLFGTEAANLVEHARTEVATLVAGDLRGVHFTTGATQSIQLALAHALSTLRKKTVLRAAVSTVEHRAAIDAFKAAERSGALTIRWLPVDSRARVDMDAVKAACDDGIDLLCVMAANNEVGTVYPTKEIARIATDAGVRTLIDATQAAGRVPIAATHWGISYLVLSAHKMYGPKGMGALVTQAGVKIHSSHGTTRGTAEGTPNVPGIVGLGEACRLRVLEAAADEERIARQRDRLESILCQVVPDMHVNGDRESRLSHNLHISVPNVPNDAVVARLHRRVAISTGAACASGAQEPSHVLRAMGLAPALQEGALRIGVGKFTTDSEIEQAGIEIGDAIRATRSALVASRT